MKSLVLISLLLLQPVFADWQDGVIVHKTPGGGIIYIFPAARDHGLNQAAGKITIGETITVGYGLEVLGGKARFILFDASKAPSVAPKLSVLQAQKRFGFSIKDTNVATLHIYVMPSFMSETKAEATASMKEKIARHGNLNVLLHIKNGKVQIENVTLD